MKKKERSLTSRQPSGLGWEGDVVVKRKNSSRTHNLLKRKRNFITKKARGDKSIDISALPDCNHSSTCLFPVLEMMTRGGRY